MLHPLKWFRALAILLALSGFNAWAQAAPVSEQIPIAQYANMQNVSKIMDDASVQNLLKAKLGSHYGVFMGNFENFSVPYQLKDGGLFVEGWSGDVQNTLRSTSAFVIYADGELEAAYFDPSLSQVRYFSDSIGNYFMHPALSIWYQQFDRYLPVLSKDNSPMMAAQFFQKKSYSLYLRDNYDPEIIEGYRKLAAIIWSPYLANRWNYNKEVMDIIDRIFPELQPCSNVVEFLMILNSFPTKPDKILFLIFVGKMVDYSLNYYNQKLHNYCLVAAAANNRSAIEMASMGI